MIDAPRGLIMFLGFGGEQDGGQTIGNARKHCELYARGSTACWPEWTNENPNAHLTKAGAAILIWSMMEAART
jgi:hypothetical protein